MASPTEADGRARAERESRLYSLFFGAAFVAWAIVAVSFVLFAPASIRWSNAVLTLVGGSLITIAVNRPDRRWATIAAGFLDVVALVLATYAPIGISEALVFPLVGSLLLVAWYRGRDLAVAFMIAWIVGVAAMSIAFVVGPIGRLDSLTYPPAAVAVGAILTALAYVTLWWVASRWHLAVDDAAAATSHYRSLIDQAADGIIVLDQDGRVIEANPTVARVLGRRSAEIVGHDVAEFVAPASLDARPVDLSTLEPGQSMLSERTITSSDGGVVPVEFRVSAMGDGRYQVIARDLTARRRGETERARLAAAVEQTTDLVIVNDPTGIIEYVNPAFEHLTGYAATEVIGRPVASVLRSNVHPAEFYAELDGAFVRGEPWRGTITDRRRDGSLFEYELSMSPIRAADGSIAGSVHVGRDTTHEREMEADLALEATVRGVLETALRSVPSGASLEQTAQALCDALGRLPGIAFVTVFAFTAGAEIAAVAYHAPPGFPEAHGRPAHRALGMHQRAAHGPWTEAWVPREDDGTWGRALTELGTRAAAFGPIVHGDHVDGVVMVTTPDEGLARILIDKGPSVLDLSTTPSALLAEGIHAQRERAELRRSLERVLVEHAFHAVFQPIVELASGEVVGHEALTRFASGQPPDQCFADAWSVGLGPELEFATLQVAIEDARALPAGRWLDVNLSPRLLSEPDRLRGLLYGADRPLVLEITEHEIITDYPAVREAVRSLGNDVRLAVDDAGAGIANFGHIIELSPDFVKLDISLVRRVNANLGRQALVVAMRHFARTAGCRLVAEGIETIEEAKTLAGLGVEFGQGYLFGRPEPVPSTAVASSDSDAQTRSGSSTEMPARRRTSPRPPARRAHLSTTGRESRSAGNRASATGAHPPAP
ncbi:MAG: EAL domain-containing protein [Candidatus Limnocylindrales bacterium]